MVERAGKVHKLGWALAALLIAASWAYGREKLKEALFKYAGGTENLPEACTGKLEVTSRALIFTCDKGSISVPYASISLMQYRPDVTRKIRKLKLKWKLKPPMGGGKQNRYFAVLYREQGATHVMVLEVPPLEMRPYLAEIDLKAGRRVEVKGYEEYD